MSGVSGIRFAPLHIRWSVPADGSGQTFDWPCHATPRDLGVAKLDAVGERTDAIPRRNDVKGCDSSVLRAFARSGYLERLAYYERDRTVDSVCHRYKRRPSRWGTYRPSGERGAMAHRISGGSDGADPDSIEGTADYGGPLGLQPVDRGVGRSPVRSANVPGVYPLVGRSIQA